MRSGRLLLAVLLLAVLAGCAAGPVAPASQAQAPVVVQPASSATSKAAVPGGEPFDASQLDPRVTQATIGSTIAVKGYTSSVRPPESVTGPIKLSLMRQHGYDGPTAEYELDHFIPLELGGNSDLSNLWLEPIVEAQQKDKDEDFAHDKVVSGGWTLAEGQQYIRDHWRIHYVGETLPEPGFPASPDGQASVVATVSDTAPRQDVDVTVWAKVTDDLGRPVKGARVAFSWRFKTVTRVDWAVTDGAGVASDTRGIGRATMGYRVNVDLTASAAGKLTGTVSFVPR